VSLFEIEHEDIKNINNAKNGFYLSEKQIVIAIILQYVSFVKTYKSGAPMLCRQR
jgi:hypothetical protein